MANRWRHNGNSDRLYLGGGSSKITADGKCCHEIKTLVSWNKSYDQPRQHIKKQRDHFDDKVPYSWNYGCFCSHVQMWELDHKEEWLPKNWCFWTVVLEKTLESPLDCKEIQPVHSEEISPECPSEGLMLKQNLQYFGHLMRIADSLGRSWCWERFRPGGDGNNRERETVGWHHWLNGHEFEQTLEHSEGQGSLACCSPWGHKELDTTERLNWTEQGVN